MKNHVYETRDGHRIHLLSELTWGTYQEADNYLMKQVGKVRIKLAPAMAKKKLTPEQKQEMIADALEDMGLSIGASELSKQSEIILRKIAVKVATKDDTIIEGEDQIMDFIYKLPAIDSSHLYNYAEKLYLETQKSINDAKKKKTTS